MHATTQNAEAILILVLLGAMAIVAFWKTVIKLIIAAVATATLAFLGYGAIMMWLSMHHMTG